MELLTECPFTFDKEKKIGHMRCDYDGGRDVRPYKSWFPSGDIKEICEEHGIDLADLDNAVNMVINEHCPTYSAFLNYIPRGLSDYDSVNYFFQYNNVDVWVRMIPAPHDYNIYINLYHQ